MAQLAKALAGKALITVWRSILYRWPGPVQGWVPGRVIRFSSAAVPGSQAHMGCAGSLAALSVVEASSLLDALLHGPRPAGRWVMLRLCPA